MEGIQARGICLDTSVLIGFLKARQPANAAVKRAITEQVCFVAAMSAYELLFGVARARKSIGEEALLDREPPEGVEHPTPCPSARSSSPGLSP